MDRVPARGRGHGARPVQEAPARAKEMKLGGWQRLWILLSVIWLFPVALVTVQFMPESPPEKRELDFDLLVRPDAARWPRGATPKEPTHAARVARQLQEAYGKWIDFREVESKHKNNPAHRFQATTDLIEKEASLEVKVAGGKIIVNVPKGISKEDLEQLYAKRYQRPLRWEKAKIGMYGVLAWLTSIGLLYLLGATIGWVVRGFRAK